jgi:hypothetical protein
MVNQALLNHFRQTHYQNQILIRNEYESDDLFSVERFLYISCAFRICSIQMFIARWSAWNVNAEIGMWYSLRYINRKLSVIK